MTYVTPLNNAGQEIFLTFRKKAEEMVEIKFTERIINHKEIHILTIHHSRKRLFAGN